MTDPRPLEETIPQLQALLERSRDGRSEEVALLLVSRNVLEPLLALVTAAWNHEKECCYHCNFDHFDLGEKIEAVARALSDALPEKGATNGG